VEGVGLVFGSRQQQLAPVLTQYTCVSPKSVPHSTVPQRRRPLLSVCVPRTQSAVYTRHKAIPQPFQRYTLKATPFSLRPPLCALQVFDKDQRGVIAAPNTQ
jgi:hypothetical protein